MPGLVATLRRTADGVLVDPAPAAAIEVDGRPLRGPTLVRDDVELRLGEGGPPSSDAVAVALLRRGARHVARTFDPRAAAERPADDLAWFEPDRRLVVEARVERPEAGVHIPVVNALGDAKQAPVAAILHFELDGGPWSLIATDEGEHWFVNFRDATNGVSTYGAGRFLVVAPTRGDRATLDFNRAYHPPCAHTPHATCPLPPVPNRIRAPVEAGERTALQRRQGG